MKILLVRPPSINMSFIIPSLGLGYLASILTNEGHDVSILDCLREGIDHNAFYSCLEYERPDIIGIQVFTCDFTSSRKCLQIVKKWNKEKVTIIGGPHSSGDSINILNAFPEADFGFFGEAEIGLPKLVNRIGKRNNIDLEDIDGLIYKKENNININRPGFEPDLNRIPFPCWDKIKPGKYPPSPHGTFTNRLPTAPVITSRGCPFECPYCTASKVNGKIVRERRIENILDEIEYLLEMHGIREIHIEDDNFTLSKNRVIQFCKEIESRNLDFSWALPNGIKLDTIDREMMRCMEEAGCYSLAVGIESGSPRILLEMNRNTTLEKVREKIEIITRETNIRITGMFILGYANETVKEMNMTIDFACGLPLHRAQFGFFLPLPGTDIYKRMVETAEIN